MATKKKRIIKPKVTKRKVKKKNTETLKKKIKLLFFLIISSFIVALSFLFKNDIVLYYRIFTQGFRQEKLVNSRFESLRINRVIKCHKNKIFGIDISHYQRREDFKWDSLTIRNQMIPIKFVLMRASMGASNKDNNFNYFWKKTKRNNYIRGAYHYYRPDENPVKQAENFINNVNLLKGDLHPVLDIEQLPKTKNHKELVKNIKIWIKLVEKVYNVKPIIYTYYHFYKSYLKHDLKNYPLWLANYNNVTKPQPNNHWMFWQFTDKGIVKGINTKVDINVFKGTINDLNTWIIK